MEEKEQGQVVCREEKVTQRAPGTRLSRKPGGDPTVSPGVTWESWPREDPQTLSEYIDATGLTAHHFVAKEQTAFLESTKEYLPDFNVAVG